MVSIFRNYDNALCFSTFRISNGCWRVIEQNLYVTTLLHELVHLRQWVRGQLKYRSGRMLFNEERVTDMEYVHQPHEIEAFALENSLYLDYMYDTTGHWYGDE